MGRHTKPSRALGFNSLCKKATSLTPEEKKIIDLQIDVTSGLNNILRYAHLPTCSYMLEAAEACFNAEPRLICKKAYDLCKKLNRDANKIKHQDVLLLVKTFNLDYMEYLGYNPY